MEEYSWACGLFNTSDRLISEIWPIVLNIRSDVDRKVSSTRIEPSEPTVKAYTPVIFDDCPKIPIFFTPSRGADATKFRNFDAQTHEAALAMKLAAASSDGKAVIQSFAHVQESCLGCHQAFRKPFVEHFYGAR